LIRFDDVRGYGFIAPEGGGEDVFVHANDFGEDRHRVYPGIRVEFEVEQGDRGPKVASVQIPDGQRSQPAPRIGVGTVRAAASPDEDDGMCDVLTGKQLTAEVTELLLQHVPTLTAAQVTQIRERLVAHARSHGWIES
jgi:cold shock CspA family protein